MKGALKAIKRTPHMFTSKVGMSSQSQDLETNELVRRFTQIEENTAKLVKDVSSFRDGVSSLLSSQDGFGKAFAQIFQPMGSEASLNASYPEAAKTVKNIASYEEIMSELRVTIQPDLELVDSRIVAPLKEFNENLKKIRKTITKREHKLLDYDRFNNSYTKLKDKKEKSLSDEKNLFKTEQDLEIATNEYEHYNGALKAELPHFFQLTTAFITPLYQTFYFVKVAIIYNLYEKMQEWTGTTYGEFDISQLDALHQERIGDLPSAFEALTITKRFAGTAQFMAKQRQLNGEEGAGGFGRSASRYSTTSKLAPPPLSSKPIIGAKPTTFGSKSAAYTSNYTPAAVDAPPPYASSASPAATKRAPPPPPNKPRIGKPVEYVTAIYDYTAQQDGDLTFVTGDKIELVKKTDNVDDWWTGRINGVEGIFPGTYVQ